MNNIEILRKKLLYQSCHRGCKETDILLGDFAKLYINKFNDQELMEYARLLEVNDADIYQWIIGNIPIPPEFDTTIFKLIIKFNQNRHNNENEA